MTNDYTNAKEVVSPEGVKEKLVREIIGRVTFTLGGNFRTYMIIDGNVVAGRVFDTKEEAVKDVGFIMALTGSMDVDAKGTVDKILESFSRRNGP